MPRLLRPILILTLTRFSDTEFLPLIPSLPLSLSTANAPVAASAHRERARIRARARVKTREPKWAFFCYDADPTGGAHVT